MTLNKIKTRIADDFAAVNELIIEHLNSRISLIQQLGQYILYSGGKRIRPVVTLLCANALQTPGKNHIHLAALIEFIHTATLLHDDVVDSSQLRRGNETANAIWGNEASVLVGDFLFSRAFQMMVTLDSMRILEVLANVTNVITEGEAQQLMNRHNPNITIESYMQIIHAKTASLFSAATQCTAILSRQDEEIEQAMQDFGAHLGLAFQIVDDVLDYNGDAKNMGKNIGDDLAEGKLTLPLIYVLQNGNLDQQQLIKEAISKGGLENLESIRLAIASTHAIKYTHEAAKQQAAEAKKALNKLNDSVYRQALHDLVDFAIHRDY